MSNYYKFPIPSSRLTEIRKNRMVYADYISKTQGNNQGCDTSRTGLENGGVAPGSIVPDLLDGARNTTAEERDAILTSTACPTAPSSSPPSITYSVVQPGLALYYDVGNSASYPGTGTSIFDLSPNGYTGTLNGPVYNSANGGSLVFDGINDYIDTNQSIGSEEFTLMAWVKSSNTSTYQMIFSKETAAGLPWNYRLFLDITTGNITGDMAKTGSSSVISFAQTLADGTWHLVGFSRNTITDRLTLYIDGNFIKSDTDTIAAGTIINAQEVWIGLSAFSGGLYPFNGNIAATFIYTRPLTDAEVFTNWMATRTRFGV
jgi:hypothetical protein